MAKLDPKGFEDRLWTALEDERTGMLGLMGEDVPHMHPMTGFGERETGSIWFFARRDNALVRRMIQGGPAMFNLVSKDREMWVCVAGTMTEQHDGDRIAKYWGPEVAAWFPKGKDDPELTLLRFDAVEAEVWVQTKGPIRFALEIAKSRLTGSEPDVGRQGRLNLH